MTSQPGLQTIVICILPHISQSNESNGDQTMNLVNYWSITEEIFFFKNYAENEAGRLVPDLFLFIKEA